jgi:hypothetical protein
MKQMRLLILTVFLSGIAVVAKATNLRGQLLRIFNGVSYPIPNARVDLWVFNGQQWVDLSYSITGRDGMYYFVNVPPGINFKIQANQLFFPAEPLFLTNVPLFDIPQIYL